MEKKILRLLHIHRSRGVTRPLIRKMLKIDPSFKDIYHLSSSQLSKLFTLPYPRANELYDDLHSKSTISDLYRDLKKYKVITLFDSNYSPMLKTINDPPFVLYCLGHAEWLSQQPALSVVGTRNPTAEAKRKMDAILSPLIDQGWIIVSGMAKGIDGYAHQQAIQHAGRTIAVLGNGFDYIYPKQHGLLFNQLVKTQLVLTEYPPNVPPRRYQFPERNRIISGLGFGTIVIEAKERSGSLITVEQALDQGREVYAVPGSPLHPQSRGCHQMIQDGAKLVQNTQDLAEEWSNQEVKWRRMMLDFQ